LNRKLQVEVMMLKTFFVISGLLFMALFGTKMVLHLILDWRNNYPLGLSGYHFGYLTKYDKEVRPDDARVRDLCNRFHTIGKYSFLLFLGLFLFWKIQTLNSGGG
jgi:hypothetical protein